MARSQLAAPTLPLSQLPPVPRLLVALAQVSATWDLRYKGRRALRDLDPHLLRDIGLTAQSAEVESSKPFWRD